MKRILIAVVAQLLITMSFAQGTIKRNTAKDNIQSTQGTTIGRISSKKQIHKSNSNLDEKKLTEKDKQRILSDLQQNMIYVEGGTYRLPYNPNGSTTEVWDTITINNFYISKYEVTQELWTAVMGSNPSMEHGWNTPKVPVNCISRDDCDAFTKRLQELTGLSYRLPTYSEWCVAAMGGRFTKGYKYSGSDNVNDVAWYGHIDDGQDWAKKVGQKMPNELGLYDMSGNVWEFVNDYDSKGSALLFGGCISAYDEVCQTCDALNHAYSWPTDQVHRNIGLRLVADTQETINAKTNGVTQPSANVDIESLIVSANNGDAKSQYNLGCLYLQGLNGVKQDYNKALEWYLKSANQNNMLGQYGVGYIYEQGLGVTQDYIKAAGYFQKAANQGEQYSMFQLGWLYNQGNGVKKDVQKAYDYFLESANKGVAKAQTYVGHAYLSGVPVTRDYAKARA